ncbi:uncharacterized protein [Dermacentor andersoni]|uniref:uncharacterized protein n=1 Tax=Dermacentor andersoni TaxID=34620 RepID=UPI003B3B2FE3
MTEVHHHHNHHKPYSSEAGDCSPCPSVWMAYPRDASITMGGPHGGSSEALSAIPVAASPLQSPPAMRGDMLDRRRVTADAMRRRQAGEREYVRQIDSASLEGNESAVEDFWCDDSREVVLLRRTMMKLDQEIGEFNELLSLTCLKVRALRAVVRCMSVEVKCSRIEAAISISRARRIIDDDYGLPRQPQRRNHQPADRAKNPTEFAVDGPVYAASTTNMATSTRPARHEGSSVTMTEGSVTGGESCSGAKPAGSALRGPRRLVPAMTGSARSAATRGTTPSGRCTFMLSTMDLSPETKLTGSEHEEKETARFLTDVVMRHGSGNHASHGISSNKDTA